MSARAVAELVEKDCGVKISARTIQQKVKEGNVGVSPLRRGPKGNIPDRSYQNLCLAYESYVTINQINGTMRNCRRKNVGPLLQRVIYGHAEDWDTLFKRVQNSTASNLRRQKPKNAEDRRIRWTTGKNLNRWFDNWEDDLVELGFGTRDESGAVYIPRSSYQGWATLMRHVILMAATLDVVVVLMLLYTIPDSQRSDLLPQSPR